MEDERAADVEAGEDQNAALEAAIAEAREGFPDALGSLALQQIEAGEKAAEIDSAAGERIAQDIESAYGDFIRGLDPQQVAELDRIAEEDGLATALARIDQMVKGNAPAPSEPLTSEDRAVATARRHAELDKANREAFDSFGAAVRRDIAKAAGEVD